MLACTIFSLTLANSQTGSGYTHFWHTNFFSKPLEFWVNEVLMSFFFLLVGLEIKREIFVGELNDFKKSVLPVLAAFGGMLLPALIHFVFNHGTVTQNGYGIPMATDIAFSLGLLSLLGKRIPLSSKVFLTALAIIDDLGAIIIIAIFYTDHLSFTHFGMAALVAASLLVLNRLQVSNSLFYLALGGALWYFLYRAGIHPTIAGVALAFAIPLGTGNYSSLSAVWQHRLHKPITFVVLPIFAMANTAIVLPNAVGMELLSHNSLGIFFGLVLGKPLGIFLFAWAGVTLGWCVLPQRMQLKHVFAVGILAGIGFTMSIFITLLAFDETHLVDESKMAVLLGSFVSGTIGIFALMKVYR